MRRDTKLKNSFWIYITLYSSTKKFESILLRYKYVIFPPIAIKNSVNIALKSIGIFWIKLYIVYYVVLFIYSKILIFRITKDLG